ncbi:hypothetical protein L0F63_004305 [Massospora cicadina]|nr:hypothetical protein L0F63_004305 [Massospora cicadina]
MASVGSSVHLAGWGKPDPYGPVSQSLKSVDLRVVDDGRCSQYGKFNPASHICVSSDIAGTSACNGDSESPLVAQDINDILKFLIHNFLSICPSDTLVVHTCLNDTLVVHTRLNDTLAAHTCLNDTLAAHTCLSDTLAVQTCLCDTHVVHISLSNFLATLGANLVSNNFQDIQLGFSTIFDTYKVISLT